MFRSLFKKLHGDKDGKGGAEDAAQKAAKKAEPFPAAAASMRVRKVMIGGEKQKDEDEEHEQDEEHELELELEPPINPIAAQANASARAEAPVVNIEPSLAKVADPAAKASAEELCGIDPASMDRDAIRAHLAILYRRHNAAASSLNSELRDEAEQMLDAIITCREAYVDHI